VSAKVIVVGFKTVRISRFLPPDALQFRRIQAAGT